MRVVKMALPGGEQQVMCQRLTVASLAALGQLDALASDAGASVGWLGAAYSVAIRLVTAGAVRDLAETQPPVVAVASPGFTAEELTTVIIESFVDQTSRLLLAGAGWHPPITDTRRLAARAMRATARALSAPAGEFRAEVELADALDDLAAMFDHTIRRAEGEPVVRARLRLALPEEPSGDWPLSLELVDPDDRGRWCAANDVRSGSAAALNLAGSDRYLPMLADCIHTARVDIELIAPWLTDWLSDPTAGVDLDGARAGIEIAAFGRVMAERRAHADHQV